MRKNSYIFTAILAIVVSTGAWADAPTTDAEREAGTVHDVYKPTGLADSGIAGVTYVNRVGEMAGAAAAAAEAHAADASKSAYAAQTSADDADTKAAAAAAAAAAAQSSADAAATAANSITNGNGITIDTSETGKKKITVNPKANAGISVDSNGVAVKAGNGISVDSNGVAVKAGNGISVGSNGVAVKASNGISVGSNGVAVVANTNKGISVDSSGVAVKAGNGISVGSSGVAVNEGVGLKFDNNVLTTNIVSGDNVTITPDADDTDKLVISVTGAVTLADGTENVGTNARPVYVNNGTATAVQSIAIPVGSENFSGTSVAKIWIQ